jgi:hypothetical protein
MAPIHDTDLASDRWAKAEWEKYELWEKVELKLRRRKWLLVAATAFVFLGLSSIPIVMDHRPKWEAVRLSRRLADQLGALKRDAAISHRAFRIRFKDEGDTAFVVESAFSCDGGDLAWSTVRSGALEKVETGGYAVLTPAQGRALGVPGLVDGLCYDPQSGSDIESRGDPLAGFGVISKADLSEHRIDRLGVVLVNGASAEISFE